MNKLSKSDMTEGQDYYTIDDFTIIWSVWDDVSNEINDNKDVLFPTYEDAFRELCKWHDWGYEYSDSHSVWLRGTKTSKAIHRAVAMAQESNSNGIAPAIDVDFLKGLIEDYRKPYKR